MASGKKTNNAPTEEFILEAPAPVDVAAKVSAIYRALSVEVNASNFIYRKTYSELCTDYQQRYHYHTF